jgi:hypothetical protein
MTTKTIKRGQAGFTIETQRSDDWTYDGTVAVDVLNLTEGAATPIIEDGAVTVYGGDTLAQDADAGSFEIVLTTGTALEAGDSIAIGTDAAGYEQRIVKSYTAATKTVVLTTCLDRDRVAGLEVLGLDMSAVIDASLEGFDNLQEVSVRWKQDGDGLTMTEMWRVLSVENQPAGLEAAFKAAYPACADAVDDIGKLSDRAEQWLIMYFETRGRDYKLVVDNELTKEALMAKMALMVGVGNDLGEIQYARIESYLEEMLSLLDGLPVWIDDDEDGIQDEDETQKAQDFGLSRGL